MDHNFRVPLYQQVESELDTKLITFVTSSRPNAETQINDDCIDFFADILDVFGEVERITLLIHTLGGNPDAAWKLIGLIKMYCNEFNLIVPSIAMSAGTLMALGADKIILPNRAVLGPIDPSINHEFGPVSEKTNVDQEFFVSVEDLYGFLKFAKQDLHINNENTLGSILEGLLARLHPLVIGNIFRVRSQIQDLARELLESHNQPTESIDKIVDFLCTESGSHSHAINRKAAEKLGLKVEKPKTQLLSVINKIRESYSQQLKLSIPFNPFSEIGFNNYDIRNLDSEETSEKNEFTKEKFEYTIVRSLIESANTESFGFHSSGEIRIEDENYKEAKLVQLFDGWVKF